MSMSIGGATVAVIEHKHGAMHCDAFKGKLEAVLQMIDRGDLGGGGFYGCDEHKAALARVEQQIAETRRCIAEQEAQVAADERTETIGMKIEGWVCHGMPTEPLTDAQRTEIREYAEGFEECPADHDELVDMGDHDLIRAAYQAMADYARGQM